MPMETNPRVVFERMFGRPGSPEERLTRMRQNRSILDSVQRRRRLARDGASARATRRASTSISTTCARSKTRIQRAEKTGHDASWSLPNAPIGIPESWEEHATVMFDLMALACEADLTRVFSFMLNREASQLVFPNLGFNEPWHHVSHHGNEPEKLALLVKLNTWQIDVFGRFLDRLRNTPDGDGTLLDHSVLLWGSGMSDSNTHSPLDVPYLMVGKGAGAFKGNRHLAAPKGTQLANVMLTVAQKFGAEIDRFGVSTGAFTALSTVATCSMPHRWRLASSARRWPASGRRPGAVARRRRQARRSRRGARAAAQQGGRQPARGRRHDGAALGRAGRRRSSSSSC